MEQAGHECMGHCEIDKFADKSYRAMHNVKGDEWYAADIRNVKPGDLPEADCWCGGFPCQAFSIAGKRSGFEDMRGTLIFEIFRLAAERKPKIMFLENVEGLLNHDNGRTFATILNGFRELRYDVQWQLLNSKNFGVPQNRSRVFIVGYYGGFSGREIFPIYGTDGKAIKRHQGDISGKGYASQQDRVYDPDGIMGCVPSTRTENKVNVFVVGKDGKQKNKDYASCLTGGGHSGGNHSDMDLIIQPVLTPDREEKRQNGRRIKEDGEPMFTLTAQDRHGVCLRPVRTDYGKQVRKQYETGEIKESRHNMTKLEPREDGIANTITSVQKDNLLLQETRIRRLTPKECFRLQGFPDEYFERAREVNSDSQLYKQAGNSVTVPVIYEIAKKLGV